MPGAIRLGLSAAVLTAALAGAAPAAAATLFVSTGGTDASNDCQAPGAPCLTIDHAIAAAEATSGPATIDLAPGTYSETVTATNPADFGLTVAGTGADPGSTVIQGPGGASTETIQVGGGVVLGSLTLSNLSVENPSPNTQPAIVGTGDVTLDGVDVTLGNAASSARAIQDQLGTLTLNGSSLTVDGTGAGLDVTGALALDDSTVALAGGGSAVAVDANQGSATITGSTITSDSGSEAVFSSGSPLTIASSTVAADGTGGDVVAQTGSLTATDDTFSMTDSASSAPAVEAVIGSLDMTGSTVDGSWHGEGVEIQGGGGTIIGSTVDTDTAGSNAPAVFAAGETPTAALLLARSTLEAGPTAGPGAVLVQDSDLVTDSSLILGGTDGVFFSGLENKSNTATIASTTVDAGVPGLGAESGVNGVAALGENGHTATVLVNGSILTQAPLATVTTGGTSSVTCTDSDVPSTTQAASSTLGQIACAPGQNGDTATASLSALFVAPGIDYQLVPGSTAVDSVPEPVVALPDGFGSSMTDLAGNPRVVDGKGDCAAVRDKGAYELQGHAGTIPAPAVTAPSGAVTDVPATFGATVRNDPAATLTWRFSDGGTATGSSVTHAFTTAGSATATVTATGSPSSCSGSASATITVVAPPAVSLLSLSSTSFRPVKSGGPTAKTRSHGRGATIRYTDSEAGTTTFTIDALRAGRLAGTTCEKPGRHNRRSRRCTYMVALGSFTHADTAGANTFVLTGRLDGRALPAGTYELSGVPGNANGAGAAITQRFRIT